MDFFLEFHFYCIRDLANCLEVTDLAISWGGHCDSSSDPTQVQIGAPTCLCCDILRPKKVLTMHEQFLGFSKGPSVYGQGAECSAVLDKRPFENKRKVFFSFFFPLESYTC